MPFVTSIRKNHNREANLKKESVFELEGGDSVIVAGGYKIHTFTSVGEAELRLKLARASEIGRAHV